MLIGNCTTFASDKPTGLVDTGKRGLESNATPSRPQEASSAVILTICGLLSVISV
jgi:hypothetical protein